MSSRKEGRSENETAWNNNDVIDFVDDDDDDDDDTKGDDGDHDEFLEAKNSSASS